MRPGTDEEYRCSPGGSIAVGRRRLALLLSALAALLLLTAAVAWAGGRLFPGLLALSVAVVVALAWRMSNDLLPRRLWFDDQDLQIQTLGRLIPVPTAEATIRRLDDDEIRHLEMLTSTGGFIVGSGGFDSRYLGEFDLYGSDLDNAVLIQSPEGRFVVTPDRPDRFVESFRKHAASPLLQSRGHD